MTKTIEAIYENGMFRPVKLVKGLKKQQRVILTLVNFSDKKHQLAGLCGILPDNDAEEILKIVEDEFEKVAPSLKMIYGLPLYA